MTGLRSVLARLPVRPAVLVAGAAVLAFPWLPFVSFSLLGSANLAAYYALVAVSLVVLTGWVGQISLGHAGLVGVGAYVSGHVVNGWHVTFPVNLLWAALAGAAVAAALGFVAVRVRGLYLAVATLIFGWMAAEYLFRQRWFTRNASVEVEPFGEPGTFPFFDWSSRRTYFYAAWAIVAVAVVVAANLRDSKTGRAFFAVRGSEVAAASLGISVMGTKLTAFAVSGAMAAMAGNLLLVRDQVVTPDSFEVEVSLFFLAIAVVGGLSSLGGAVAAAVLFAALNELFFRLDVLSGWLEVVPPVLLTTVLLLYRGGLAAVPGAVRTRVGPWLAPLADRLPALPAARAQRRAQVAASAVRGRVATITGRLRSARRRVAVDLPDPAGPAVAAPAPAMQFHGGGRLELHHLLAGVSAGPEPTAASEGAGNEPPEPPAEHLPTLACGWRDIALTGPPLAPRREDRPAVLDASGITVQFGGLVAVDDVSLAVRQHEIVGLIGPNGAGKTTTFNAIAGLNVPTAGRVQVFGQDVTDWPVDRRARLGMGRTFQAIQLLPQLTVFDNLLVATHLHNPSGFVSHVLVGPTTLAAERDARQRVRVVARLLELDDVLHREVADLPFGVLRMVELARALVTCSPLIMLDEPASGLDTGETEHLADLLRFVRDLGVTLLLIEHDVSLVVSVSDYLYVLDHGRLLAEGPPAAVQQDERVIAAYLGTPGEGEDAELVGVSS